MLLHPEAVPFSPQPFLPADVNRKPFTANR
jgi:hypothetical protein